jgi:hypothetical protein
MLEREISHRQENVMRPIFVIGIAITFLCGACSKTNSDSRVPEKDVARAVLSAEQAAKRAHLSEELVAAGTNMEKLARVYLTAKDVGNMEIQTESDARMESIAKNKMLAVPSRKRAKKLLALLPKDSQAAETVRRSKIVWE